MARQKKITGDDRIKQIVANLRLETNAVKDRWLPEPNRVYGIGEQVIQGMFDTKIWTVTKVIDSMKGIYEIEYQTCIPSGEDFVHTSTDIWYNLYPISYPKADKKYYEESQIHIDYAQMDLEALFTRHYYFGTEYDQEYQRGNVWDIWDKMLLVESIFKNIDIGKFLYVNTDNYGSPDKLYRMIDGKQRMKALTDFFEDRFRYQGYKFSQLQQSDQRRILGSMVNVGTVKGVSEIEEIELFLKINTTGKTVDSQHIQEAKEMLRKKKGLGPTPYETDIDGKEIKKENKYA